MIVTLSKCSLNVAGIVQAFDGSTGIVPTQGYDVASVRAVGVQGGSTWSAAVLKVRKTSAPWQAGADYSTVVSLTASAPASGLLAVEAAYLTVEVTTAEASYADIIIDLKPSNIAQGITT